MIGDVDIKSAAFGTRFFILIHTTPLPISCYKSSYGLQVASYELQVTRYDMHDKRSFFDP